MSAKTQDLRGPDAPDPRRRSVAGRPEAPRCKYSRNTMICAGTPPAVWATCPAATDLNLGFVWQTHHRFGADPHWWLGASQQIQSKYNGLRAESPSGLGNMSDGDRSQPWVRLARHLVSADPRWWSGASLQIQSKYKVCAWTPAACPPTTISTLGSFGRSSLQNDPTRRLGSFGRLALVRFGKFHPLLSRLLLMEATDAHAHTLRASEADTHSNP